MKDMRKFILTIIILEAVLFALNLANALINKTPFSCFAAGVLGGILLCTISGEAFEILIKKK